MAIGGVVIQFRADADKARHDVDRLTKSLDGVDGAARGASGGFSKLAKAGVAAVAVAAAMGAAALYDFAKAAALDWQESEKLARTLGKIPGVTQSMIDANAKWIDSMEIATGFSDSEFRASIARLAVATGSLTEAQTLAALAADVAAGRNISLATATQMLEKAAGGNTNALKRQMPWLDANRDGTVTMTEAVNGLTAAYGGAAKAAADNNPWERIQVVWAQLKEALGQFILPSLQALSAWFANPDNQKKLQEWIGKVGEFSYAIGTQLLEAIQTKFIPFVQNTLVPTIQSIYEWFGSPQGQAQIQSMADSVMQIAGAFKAVSDAIGWVLDQWNKLPGWVRTGLTKLTKPTGLPMAGLFETGSRNLATVTGGGRSGGGGSFGGGVTVNNYYPKPEKPSETVASAIRTTRFYGGRAVA